MRAYPIRAEERSAPIGRRSSLLAALLLSTMLAGPAWAQVSDAPDASTALGSPLTTEAADAVTDDPTIEALIAEELRPSQPVQPVRIDGRQNPRVETVGGQLRRRAPEPAEADGIRLGSFVLRPSLSQRIVSEQQSSGDDRVFTQTDGRFDLRSDWSRHQLSVIGGGVFQENLSGRGATDPSAEIDAVLRLDLGGPTTATLRAGYDFEREDDTDPNALIGADMQASIHEFSAGAGIAREFGLIRGSVDVDAVRSLYGSARLADGSNFALDDRDQTSFSLRSRLAYAASAILSPFIESQVTRTEFDEEIDRSGFERSATTYGLRTGLEIDLGEKWFGEIAAGYAMRDVDDARLASIDTFTLDGLLNWSPKRGTDVQFGALTEIESSTTADLSGSVAQRFYINLTHVVRDNLLARLGGGLTLRDYYGFDIADQYIYDASAGLVWSLNRHLDVEADIGYERTTQNGAADYDTVTIGAGLTLRR